MLNSNMEKELNGQLNREIFSGYLYLAMSAYFEEQDLPGFAHWMREQAMEEYEHGMRFFHYINRRDGRVVLEEIDKPQGDFESPLQVFELALGHEQKITGHIHDLYGLANELNDYATQSFLDWFVDEQVEEEESVGLILKQLKAVGDSAVGLMVLDKELGQRQGH